MLIYWHRLLLKCIPRLSLLSDLQSTTGSVITISNMDPIGDEDLKRIEKKMQEHVRSNHVLIREEHDRNNLSKQVFSQNPFK